MDGKRSTRKIESEMISSLLFYQTFPFHEHSNQLLRSRTLASPAPVAKREPSGWKSME